MLKKIRTSEVRLGMYLQSFEGSWLSHPFWKTRFVLEDPADLLALQKSSVAGVWIDVGKGLDVAGAPVPATPLAPTAEPPAPPPSLSPPSPPPRRVAMAEEIQRAAEVVGRSVGAVNALFGEARMGRAIDAEQCLPVVGRDRRLGDPQSLGPDQPGPAQDAGRLHLHALGGRLRADGPRCRASSASARNRRARPASAACCTTSARCWCRWRY